ncbi:hypothetical protein F1559_001010 [Cyanidiococcus yangmingshanensis]|uniref:Uncharacterized protein n=1 Tax=Cyanidiococcus yangmingshanensis TaxID=2690220 RepID=A0A7J7ILT8_9RHOD|nr:hypothetical protein F1559_001010 [Cyanidiococcus yangmingshanensis]
MDEEPATPVSGVRSTTRPLSGTLVESATTSRPNEGLKASTNTLKTLLAGGVAGAAAKTAVAPLDRVKILLQVARLHGEGIRGFYRGNSATLSRIFPYAAIQFTAFEVYHDLLFQLVQQRWWLRDRAVASAAAPYAPPYLRFLAGAMAGSTAVMITYPLDLGSHPGAIYRNIADALLSLYRKGGIRGLYSGLSATLCGIIPYAGINFYMFGKLRRCTQLHRRSYAAASQVLIGQSAAYPLETVRRRAHCWDHSSRWTTVPNPSFLDGWEHESNRKQTGFTHRHHSVGVVSTVYNIARTEGVRALYRGLSLNYIKAVPTVGISFAVYEKMRQWLYLPVSSSSSARLL